METLLAENEMDAIFLKYLNRPQADAEQGRRKKPSTDLKARAMRVESGPGIS